MEGTWPGGSRPQGILQDLPRMNLQDLPRMNLQDLPINAHASVEWHEPQGSSEQCTRISHHLALSAQSRLMECGPATGWFSGGQYCPAEARLRSVQFCYREVVGQCRDRWHFRRGRRTGVAPRAAPGPACSRGGLIEVLLESF